MISYLLPELIIYIRIIFYIKSVSVKEYYIYVVLKVLFYLFILYLSMPHFLSFFIVFIYPQQLFILVIPNIYWFIIFSIFIKYSSYTSNNGNSYIPNNITKLFLTIKMNKNFRKKLYLSILFYILFTFFIGFLGSLYNFFYIIHNYQTSFKKIQKLQNNKKIDDLSISLVDDMNFFKDRFTGQNIIVKSIWNYFQLDTLQVQDYIRFSDKIYGLFLFENTTKPQDIYELQNNKNIKTIYENFKKYYYKNPNEMSFLYRELMISLRYAKKYYFKNKYAQNYFDYYTNLLFGISKYSYKYNSKNNSEMPNHHFISKRVLDDIFDLEKNSKIFLKEINIKNICLTDPSLFKKECGYILDNNKTLNYTLFEVGEEYLIKQDPNYAFNFLSKACSNDNSDYDKCMNYGNYYLKLNKPKKSVTFYKILCNKNQEKSCNILANLYLAGKQIAYDKDKSKFYFKKSCQLGNNKSCLTYKYLVQHN